MGMRPLRFLATAFLLACNDCPDLEYSPRSYDETLDEWAGPLQADGTRERCATVESGRCSDGKQFLAQLGGFTADVRYFDAEHNFLGGAFEGDIIMGGCPNGYWGPSRKAVRCKVVEHAPLCGDAVDEPFSLPHSN